MTLHHRITAKLGDAEAFKALGDILDAGVGSRFDLSDEMLDALIPLSNAYRTAFGELVGIVRNDPVIDVSGYPVGSPESLACEAAFDAAKAVRS